VNTAINSERAKSIRETQTELDRGIRSTHNSVTKGTQQSREKIDSVERTILNALAEVKNEITLNLGNDLDRLIAMLEQFAQDFKEFEDKLDGELVNITVHLDAIDEILDEFSKKLEDIKKLEQDNLDAINDIKSKVGTVQTFIDHFEHNYGRKIKNTDSLITEITRLDPIRAPQCIDVRSALPRLLSGQNQMIEQINVIVGGVAAIGANELDLQNHALAGIATGTASILAETTAILAILTGGKIDPKKFKPDFTNLKKIVKEAIQEWVEENKKGIGEEFTNSICSSIVGESFVKFDSNSTYYPTLIFKFVSTEKLETKRYSQIQIRFLKKPDEINHEEVQSLKNKTKSLKNLSYFPGPLRCNYVAAQRMFKTLHKCKAAPLCLQKKKKKP
jgi:hypothetical protein